MKRRFLIAALLAAAALCLTFVGCSEHVHRFSEWEIVDEPTCTEAGIKSRVCECGYKETAKANSKGHTVVVIPAVDATCLTEGKTQGSYCSDCGAVIVAQQTLGKSSHTVVTDPAVDATCISDGKTTGSHCGVCGTVLVAQSVIPKGQHKYNAGEVISSATCIEKGKVKYTCLHCPDSYTEESSLPTFSASDIFDQSVKYVGEIIIFDKNGEELALGTGFVYSADGKVITNYHVMDGAYSATFTVGEKTYDITSVLAYDSHIDLAVVQINGKDLTPAKVCSLPVRAGETVYAIGSSQGMTNTYTQGIITYPSREVDGVMHVQHDAAITNGNSGGPLINVYGEVIGINTWGLDEGQNLNFAVFASELDNLVYGEPISLPDFAAATRTAEDDLFDWLMENYTGMDDSYVYFEEDDGEFVFSLTYDIEYDVVFIDVYLVTDEIELYFSVDLDDPNAKYFYYATYTDGTNENVTYGTLDAPAYTGSDELSYIEFDGDYWSPEILMSLYGEARSTLIDWFIDFLDRQGVGVTAEELGFTAFEATAPDVGVTPEGVSVLYAWLEKNYNYENETSIIYDIGVEDAYISIVYDFEYDVFYIEADWYFEDGSELYFSIDLEDDPAEYFYLAYYSDGTNENYTAGYIDATSFDVNSYLSYVEFDGDYWDEDELMTLYDSACYILLEEMYNFIPTTGTGLTLADLGFSVFEPFLGGEDVGGTAEDLVADYIAENGRYDSGEYLIEIAEQDDDGGTSLFQMVYDTSSGELYFGVSYTNSSMGVNVYFVLPDSVNGVYYHAVTNIYDPLLISYGSINETYGYVDPYSFTRDTTLTYVSYSGIPALQADLIVSYSEAVCVILDMMNLYFEEYELGITAADLGFIAFE